MHIGCLFCFHICCKLSLWLHHIRLLKWLFLVLLSICITMLLLFLLLQNCIATNRCTNNTLTKDSLQRETIKYHLLFSVGFSILSFLHLNHISLFMFPIFETWYTHSYQAISFQISVSIIIKISHLLSVLTKERQHVWDLYSKSERRFLYLFSLIHYMNLFFNFKFFKWHVITCFKLPSKVLENKCTLLLSKTRRLSLERKIELSFTISSYICMGISYPEKSRCNDHSARSGHKKPYKGISSVCIGIHICYIRL